MGQQDDALIGGAARNGRAAGVPAQTWHALVQAAPEPMFVVNEQCVVSAFNDEATKLLGWRPEEVVGRPLDALTPDHELLGCGPADAIGGSRKVDIAVLSRSGDLVDVAAAVACAEVDKGRLWVVILREEPTESVMDAALLDAEQRLASITTNVPGIVFQRVRTADGQIFYPFFSLGVREVLGFEPEEIHVTADGLLDFVHWADRDRHTQAIAASAKNLMPCVEEFRAITKSGELRWLSGSSRPHVMHDGTVMWDGVLIDITERKRAELRLEMIMDHAADGIITMDELGRIESVNAAAEHLFGYTAAEMAERPVSMLMAEPFRSEHNEWVRSYLLSGEGQPLEGTRELVGQRRDASLFPLELSASEVRQEGRRIYVLIGRDITRRKHTEQALRETEQRLRSIAANLPGLVFQRVLKADGRLEYPYVSEAARDILGRGADELMANPELFLESLSPHDRELFMAGLRRSARTLEPIEDEVRITRRDGQQRWLRGHSRPRRLENGDVVWDGVSLDVTDRKRAEERLLFLAYHDPVTGVANRALFLERFGEIRRFAERTRSVVAVLCVGIDRFSIINTTMGHAFGDEVLAAMARRLQTCLPEQSLLARATADRFLVLLSGLKSEKDIDEWVDAIMVCSRRPLNVGDQEFDLTVSIGIAQFPRDAREPEELIKNADAALMRAKAQGAGTVQAFSEEMNARAMKVLSMQNGIRRALEQEEFVAFYQPQVDLRTGAIVGMEALARWLQPDGSMVSPGDFIPVAEEHGMIEALCEQVLRDACQHIKQWQDEELAAIPVAVNVSSRQFQNAKRLLCTIEDVLSETGLEAKYLEIELTESSAMRDADTAIAVVHTLKEMGLSSAIDDFGTGYSSLSVLKRFPIQKLKIDRSFVRDTPDDVNDAAIVRAIVAMSQALRLKTVAEGVEEVSQLHFLRELGCDQIQGFLFSPPLPAEKMRAMLAEKRRFAVNPSG